MHGAAEGALLVAKVAHGGKEEGDALFVAPDACAFGGDFGHPEGVVRGVEAVERRGMAVELVAEDEDEAAEFFFRGPGHGE
jgi:hypothetical protein